MPMSTVLARLTISPFQYLYLRNSAARTIPKQKTVDVRFPSKVDRRPMVNGRTGLLGGIANCGALKASRVRLWPHAQFQTG